ncbi:MAG TPA: hypothetical protein VLT36_17250, partial [Candidatus Dormibacteraeota bacterium]|nr:hypothetical protein [Candidatus Dormibacteraeota bacterium]
MRPLGVPPEPDLPETPEYFGDPYGSNVYRNRTEIPDEGAVLPPGGQFQIRADLESGPLTDSQLQQIKSNES